MMNLQIPDLLRLTAPPQRTRLPTGSPVSTRPDTDETMPRMPNTFTDTPLLKSNSSLLDES